MSDFDELYRDIQDGKEGKNRGIPMGFDRLNRYISIRKRIYTLIFGSTGSGKSAFVHDAWILNPYDWYISKANTTNVKLKIMLFSMERSKRYVQAKWLSRKIFLDHGILIPVQRMLGWWHEKLTEGEDKLCLSYKPYIDGMTESIVDVIEGTQNPTAIFKYVTDYAKANGKIEQISEYKKIYVPNHPNEIVIPIVDHNGLTRREKGMEKKDAIDKLSEYFQLFRDLYGYSPVGVSQINRDLGNVLYRKMDSFEPTIDQVKESGRPAEDSDCVVSLFDPLRYGTTDQSYDASRFVNNKNGAKHFRSVKILKNTYGEDDVRIGMAFHGATGIFKELPKAVDTSEDTYTSVISGEYFLPQK